MNCDEDGAYDLDLDSFLGIPPMPGTLRGCQHVQRDGWSDQVREPGGLRLDEIQVLGERASTSCRRPAGRGGTVYDQHGVPIDDDDNVAGEDVRTHDQWLAAKAAPSTAAGASRPTPSCTACQFHTHH